MKAVITLEKVTNGFILKVVSHTGTIETAVATDTSLRGYGMESLVSTIETLIDNQEAREAREASATAEAPVREAREEDL